MRWITVFVLMVGGVAHAQLSPEEAERKLHERQAMRVAASTQPASQAMVDRLTTQIASMEREIATLKAENEKLRNGVVFDDTAKPVVKSNTRGRLSGISGAGGAIDKIPSRLMSKKMEDETTLDTQLRDKWIEDNYAGYSISISKATLSSVTGSSDGYAIRAHGQELGSPPSDFGLSAEIAPEFKGRILTLNEGDEISIVGNIKSISMHRTMMRFPKVEKLWPGMDVTISLTDARIISVVRKPPKRDE